MFAIHSQGCQGGCGEQAPTGSGSCADRQAKAPCRVAGAEGGDGAFTQKAETAAI